MSAKYLYAKGKKEISRSRALSVAITKYRVSISHYFMFTVCLGGRWLTRKAKGVYANPTQKGLDWNQTKDLIALR